MDSAINGVSATVLPVEIIYDILLFLSPEYLIPLQSVSKLFRAIVDDLSFWRALYVGAHLPRPPGPFSWQSAKFLQRTLVRSAKLQKRWTSQPINVVSMHSLTLTYASDWCEWVCGRWLIIRGRGSTLLSHDCDTGSAQELCCWDDHWISWSATCVTSTRGHELYVGFCTGEVREGYTLNLLEFQIDDDSGHLLGPVTYNTPTKMALHLQLKGGNTPFVCISTSGPFQILAGTLIFDTRSKIFYKFPGLGPEIEKNNWSCYYEQIVLTTSHIILFLRDSDPSKYLIQAYTIPEGTDSQELRCSHETTHDRFMYWSLLQDSVTNPRDRSMCVKILVSSRTLPSQDLHFICLDLTLPAYSTETVLPISIVRHFMFAIPNSKFVDSEHILIGTSANGLARGLCFMDSDSGISVGKFSIDATGERYGGIVGDPSPFSSDIDLHECRYIKFDGSRGRICDTNAAEESMMVAMVVDLE